MDILDDMGVSKLSANVFLNRVFLKKRHTWCTQAPSVTPTSRKKNTLTSNKHGDVVLSELVHEITNVKW